MDAESIDLAKTTVNSLPLAAGGFLKFEFVPVGPECTGRCVTLWT
jgi:hypothetical protein